MAELNLRDLTCGRFDQSLLPKPDCFLRAFSQIDAGSWKHALNYCEEKGAASFRNAVATHVLRARDIVCSEENVLATNGALHAISLLGVMLAQNRGKPTVGVEMPGYWAFRKTLRMLGVDVLPLPVDHEGASADPDILSKCDAVILTPRHHFPTNITMSDARRAAFREFAEEERVLLVEDDYSWGFDFVGDAGPVGFATESLQNTLYIGSLSKNLAPGLRLGFAVGAPNVIEQLGEVRRRIDRHSPEVLQLFLVELILSGEYTAIEQKTRESYRDRWLVMRDLLELRFRVFSRATGGLSFWVPLAVSWDSLRRIFNRAESRGVCFTSGLACFDEAPEYGVMRLGYTSVSKDQLNGALDTLWCACREVTGSPPQALSTGNDDVGHQA